MFIAFFFQFYKLYLITRAGKADITTATLQKIAKVLDVQVVDFFKEDNAEVNSYDKNILEKVKLIEQLDELQKKSLFTFIAYTLYLLNDFVRRLSA